MYSDLPMPSCVLPTPSQPATARGSASATLRSTFTAFKALDHLALYSNVLQPAAAGGHLNVRCGTSSILTSGDRAFHSSLRQLLVALIDEDVQGQLLSTCCRLSS